METLHPGLYKQEKQGSPAMEGVSTSVGAFIGTAPKGKVGEAVLITSWAQFVSEYGGYDINSYLAYAVKGFFDNGGSKCYVVRTVKYDGTGSKSSVLASLDIKDTTPSTPKVVGTIKAINDGAWGNKLAIEVKAGSVVGTSDLVVYLDDAQVEIFEGVTPDTIDDLLVDSKYVVFIPSGVTGLASTLAVVTKTNLAGGADGLTGITDSDYVGSQAYKNGLYALDNYRVNLVAIPGITTPAVNSGLKAYCENRQDCFAILEVPKGTSVTGAQTYIKTTAPISTEYGAMYYPWVKVSDPIGIGKSPVKIVPPSGHVMGIFAKADSAVGCWRAPAGTDFILNGVIGLEANVNGSEQDILNPLGINCLRVFEGYGATIWGARTLSKGDYKYIPVRRVMQYVGQTLLNDLMWTVFRNNDENLWNGIKSTVDTFLNGLWAQGGLKGASPKEAYFVVCDASINTQSVVDAGLVYVDIGIATNKPAEFIVFRLALKR
jgi:phage tail sheath protein FI